VSQVGSLRASMNDRKAILVADASTVINVNATGCAEKIIGALSSHLVIVDIVPGELEGGRQRGRQDADFLNELVISGLVEIVKLDEEAEKHFEALVVGPAEATLDDGEAATIAYAVRRNGIPVIDERKANRICAERFPNLRVACTVDIFTDPKVQEALGKNGLVDAVFNALSRGRMRVLPRHVEWVLELIGAERAALCASLPNNVRGAKRAGAGKK
jgi:predicted nucleic acid-binding protein